MLSYGTIATLNHEVDFDTAAIMAEEYGVKIEREIVVKDGICTAHVDKKRGTVTKDHYCLEEGLVEKHSKDTIEHFYEYLKSEKDLSFSPILQRFKRKFMQSD